MKKKIVIMVVVLFALFGVAFGAYTIKADGKKDIASHYFPQKSQEYIRNMMIYNGETYEYNGFIFTLENSVYVSKCDMGYYVMSIKQEDGGVEQLKDIIDEKKAIIVGSYDFDYELEGNVLYCYGRKACDIPEVGQVVVDSCLVPRNPEIYNWKAFKFNLKDSGGAKVYGNETFEADVCPLGIRVVKEGKIRTNEVILNYSNGKDVIIYKEEYDENGKEVGFILNHSMDNGCGLMGVSGVEGKDCFVNMFDEWFDISELESVTVNGEVLEIINE